MPSHLDEEKIINMIGPEKDVDGLHPFNLGSLMLKRHFPYFIASTPLGVIEILEEIYGSIDRLSGKRVALIGRTNLVGMPLYLLLNKYNSFVNVCFNMTPDDLLKDTVSSSDIIIAACGVPGLIKANWIKKDAVVIDVGCNFVVPGDKEGQKPRMSGDVEFNEELLKRCKMVTPVPGGVGPMTITMLMSNLVKSWELQLENNLVGKDLEADNSCA